MYIPEWNDSDLFLVSPETLKNRSHLINNYKAFIKLLLEHGVKPTLILDANKKDTVFSQYPINFIESSTQLSDIWIRDWMPISARKEDKIVLHKYIYEPSYNLENSWDHYAGLNLSEKLDREVVDMPMILDGGNFCTNEEITFVSKKFLADNAGRDIKHSDFTFIDPEPGDVTGHTDSLIRFINKNTLLIHTFKKEDYKKGWEWCQIFRQNLEHNSYIRNNIRTIQIQNAPPSGRVSEGVPSAFGNYLNYARVGDKIFLPQYGREPYDSNAVDFFKNIDRNLEIIPVGKEICEFISHLGGVLNCITWNKYN